MSGKVLTIIVVAFVIMLGSGAYIMSQMNKTSTRSTSNLTVTISPADNPKTLKDLLVSGSPQKCTYKDNIGGSDVEGTSYIAGGKVRADFTSTTEGKVNTGHAMFDGSMSYIWMDDTKTGFKMEIDPSAIQNGESTGQGFDLNKSVDYNCSNWSTDTSVFELPSDVKFSAFTSHSGVEGSGNAMENSQNLCDACNSLTGDQKTQCLAALKCQ